ncbi:hypothetical protein [Flavobacterium sp. CLA17]|uniref:hypothetical protein n=1 Tax=Flavobacterium sp. CLA17 TaxID=2724135 RepID=UPI001967C9C6|nr:hypothetical protein [Flavobacterium sp. CLA17]QSB29258.1 hypothetical protein HAV12_011135 [Flavobacterium sp. CLA17]
MLTVLTLDADCTGEPEVVPVCTEISPSKDQPLMVEPEGRPDKIKSPAVELSSNGSGITTTPPAPTFPVGPKPRVPPTPATTTWHCAGT